MYTHNIAILIGRTLGLYCKRFDTEILVPHSIGSTHRFCFADLLGCKAECHKSWNGKLFTKLRMKEPQIVFCILLVDTRS